MSVHPLRRAIDAVGAAVGLVGPTGRPLGEVDVTAPMVARAVDLARERLLARRGEPRGAPRLPATADHLALAMALGLTQPVHRQLGGGASVTERSPGSIPAEVVDAFEQAWERAWLAHGGGGAMRSPPDRRNPLVRDLKSGRAED